ncbi:MAG: hypothetical protein KME28_06055 [Pelatocladus maniniholoensis HA4357-MV3]|uniref:Uncharacterized protein n=1 Tax=Pelatocladus maniniholoensis HA4357-MV3 TaxID=1117104 RepID=A0A9E3H5R4_9NOST|nr:hypothetical protein [Pelatocladus maniniholoensis HA4357-MV3]
MAFRSATLLQILFCSDCLESQAIACFTKPPATITVLILAQTAPRKTEAATGCAKHGNVNPEAAARNPEAATGCAKHGNVNPEAAARKTEVATGCAKHGNVNPEAAARKTEVATGKVTHTSELQIIETAGSIKTYL